MNADLVPRLDDGFHLFRESLDGVTRDEPRGLDPEALEEG
jgi:hypothetical protein